MSGKQKTENSGAVNNESADENAPGKPESGDGKSAKPTEVQHPDRTRYGDWEKDGRCIDF